MNKLKPYQEPETTQAYASQILACHMLEAEIRPKQNHLHEKNGTTQIPITTFSQSNEETISHNESSPYQDQKTLDTKKLEVHRAMLERYYIQPSKQDSVINPLKDARINPPNKDVDPLNYQERILTLKQQKPVIKKKFQLDFFLDHTNSIYSTLPNLQQGRGEHGPK